MKRLLYLSLFLIIIVATGVILFKSVSVKKEIQVPFSIYRSGEQLNKITNLSKWYIPFSGNPSMITDSGQTRFITHENDLVSIEKATPFSATISHKSSDKKLLLSFIVSPVPDTLNVSKVTLVYKSTLFRQWFGKNAIENNAEKSLENLKNYMTDTKQFYGYEIKFVNVEDTSFLFSRATFPLTEKRKGIVSLFDKLIAFAEKNKSGYNGTRILYSTVSGGEITLFAGIGVTAAEEMRLQDDIEYKRMPLGKNLLVAAYQGPFGQSHKAFEALELFKSDQQLSSMAIPYQKIMSDGYDFADEQIVQLKVFYPVF